MAQKLNLNDSQSSSVYNEIVCSVYKLEAYQNLQKNCDIEIFELNQKTESLQYQLRLLEERKKFLEKKLKILEEKLSNLEENLI
jgi:predicted  nucleic acid-binding Zn-ribbon protein